MARSPCASPAIARPRAPTCALPRQSAAASPRTSLPTWRSLRSTLATFPRGEYEKFEAKQGALGKLTDGADVFAWYAAEEGWLVQLRRDLSGVAKVEIAGERATVQTARGTRYAFRRRPNGIWGMTAFTPLLLEEAERAARDHALVERAAGDYARQASPTKAP
jgi:hypothetical protein